METINRLVRSSIPPFLFFFHSHYFGCGSLFVFKRPDDVPPSDWMKSLLFRNKEVQGQISTCKCSLRRSHRNEIRPFAGREVMLPVEAGESDASSPESGDVDEKKTFGLWEMFRCCWLCQARSGEEEEHPSLPQSQTSRFEGVEILSFSPGGWRGGWGGGWGGASG